MHTPWGQSDFQKTIAPGVTFYGTPSHGGYRVLAEQNAKIHAAWRRGDGWYEEDCDWSIVALSFRDLFPPDQIEIATRIAKDWRPDGYAASTGETVTLAESFVLRRRAFERENAHRWVVIWATSATKHPHHTQCGATKGGKRDGSPVREFLIPDRNYVVGEFGYVVPAELEAVAA